MFYDVKILVSIYNFQICTKPLFSVLNNSRAGEQVKLFIVVLFFRTELKENLKYFQDAFSHSHTSLCKKHQYTSIYLAQNTFY